jgi:uncharacterized protein YacL
VVVAVLLGFLGFTLGLQIRSLPAGGILEDIRQAATNPAYHQALVAALSVVGALAGVIIGPKLAQSVVNMGNAIERMSARDKIAVGAGTFLGIILTLPFFLLLMRVPYAGIPLSILTMVAFVYLGIRALMSMKNEMRFIGPPTADADGEGVSMDRCKILDTNVIIDGRIAEVVRAEFLEGPIYVPGFVLDELQHIADSSDSLKRARGRRGLDILNAMQKEFSLVVRAWDNKLGNDPPHEVDSKLVRLAKNINGSIVTNDFNLNKVAALQGVRVLNVNELANALKPVVLPGEEMRVTVIKEGKEANQGVAYLDDGTMIVIEDGRRHISENLDVLVTSVLQTAAGKMIFARIKGGAAMDEEESQHGGARGAGRGPRFKVR